MPSTAQARAEITPLVRHDLSTPDGSMRFTAACFEGKDWSLAPLQCKEDAGRHPPLTHKLRSAMRHLNADRIFAPSPVEFNGRIILPEQLERVIPLGHGVLLFRNRDVPADGTFLRSERDAGIFSAGGCGMVVAAYRDQLIFAHAGRDCVLDRTRVQTLDNHVSRERESVVDSILDAFNIGGKENAADVHVWPMYSIKPEEFDHPFNHPAHGEYNRAVAAYITMRFGAECAWRDERAVYIDLPRIIARQCIRRGVPESNVCLDHGYLADELPHTRKGDGRYLAAVVRHT